MTLGQPCHNPKQLMFEAETSKSQESNSKRQEHFLLQFAFLLQLVLELLPEPLILGLLEWQLTGTVFIVS